MSEDTAQEGTTPYQGFLRQFRGQQTACTEENEADQAANEKLYNCVPSANESTSEMSVTEQPLSSTGLQKTNGQVPHDKNVLGEAKPQENARYSPSQGLPVHHKPDSARPKSGKVLKRKNTPALLPKVEKLYAKEKVSHDPILCEEEDEEDEEEAEKSAVASGGGGGGGT